VGSPLIFCVGAVPALPPQRQTLQHHREIIPQISRCHCRPAPHPTRCRNLPSSLNQCVKAAVIDKTIEYLTPPTGDSVLGDLVYPPPGGDARPRTTASKELVRLPRPPTTGVLQTGLISPLPVGSRVAFRGATVVQDHHRPTPSGLLKPGGKWHLFPRWHSCFQRSWDVPAGKRDAALRCRSSCNLLECQCDRERALARHADEPIKTHPGRAERPRLD